MKSAYYAAVVTNTYRMAIDSYMTGDYRYDDRWYRELLSVSHRDYATGYYFDDSHTDANIASTTGYIKEKAYLATVLSYDETTGEALCVQRNKVSVGDPMEVLSPRQTGKPLICGDMFDEQHREIPSAPHPSMKFYIKVPFPLKAGDILRAGERE